KYQIALYYKKHKKYNEALNISKEIPNDYRNIKMIMANCYKEIGDEEYSFKLYEKISDEKIEVLKKYKKFNEAVQRLKETNKFKNDPEIWKHIKNENNGLSEIADKKINEYNDR
ncbi:20979_t:CDS:1, partial [Gigaspora margarita]